MISCLCITRGDRPGLLSEAVSDFVRQTFADRELVILHDGDGAAHAAVAAIVAAHAGASIRIERTPPGPRLGELRNIAIGRARGEWICQWDDDDRYHPERLRLQWEHAQSEQAAVNYLVDQLHWFRPDNTLFWDDGRPFLSDEHHSGDDPRAPRCDAALPGYRPRRRYAPHSCAVSGGSFAGFSDFAPARYGMVLYLQVPRKQCMARGASPRDFRRQAPHSPRLLPRLAQLRDRLSDYRPNLPSMRTHLGAGTGYVTLGDTDYA